MAKIEIPITGGFYESRSLPISAQSCKNAYVHINSGGGLAPESLFGTAGIEQLATSGTDLMVNRGAHVMDGIPYFVNGEALYRLDRTVSAAGVESFNLVSLGTIPETGRVSMADNGTQLCILIPDGNGYIWNESTTTFAQITDPDFTANGDPQHVVFIDGYFLFTTDTKKIIVSALNDGLSYNALDFGSAEADPDEIVAPIVSGNQLYICGSETIELFRDIGTANFPFQRVNGGAISTGVFSAFSLINVSSTYMFIGGSTNEAPSVYIFNGGQVQVVSTDAIDYLLEQLTEEQLSNVFAWSYSEGGSRFVGFTLPDTTVVYDLVSQRWHERSSFAVIDDVATEFRYRVNSVVKAYGRILVGDGIDGRVGELSLNYFDEYSNNIIRQFSTIPMSNQGNSFVVPSIELTVESGVGTADEANPVIVMERSLDGKTWTDGISRNIGKIGEYKNRCIWRRCGRAARFEVFRFTMSDKVKPVFIKLEADIL